MNYRENKENQSLLTYFRNKKINFYFYFVFLHIGYPLLQKRTQAIQQPVAMSGNIVENMDKKQRNVIRKVTKRLMVQVTLKTKRNIGNN